MMRAGFLTLVFTLVAAMPAPARQATAPTPIDWVAMGTQLHGGFGSYLALGVHIGLDALKELRAERRAVHVTFLDGAKTPCPCVADGVIMATGSTPGRGNFVAAPEKAESGAFAVVVVRDTKTGRTLRYVVPDGLREQLDAWNTVPAADRLGVIAATPSSQLFRREDVSGR